MSLRSRNIALVPTVIVTALISVAACSSNDSSAPPGGSGNNTGTGNTGNSTSHAGSTSSAGGTINQGFGGQTSSAGQTAVGGSGVVSTGGVGGMTVGSGGVPGTGGMVVGSGGMSAAGAGGMAIMCAPEQNRCDCHTSVGLTVNSWVDTFEDGTLKIQEIDERAGEWFISPAGKGENMVVADNSGGAPGSTKALHMSGGELASQKLWPTFGVPLGTCYDASAFDGITFWIKGDTSGGKNDTVKVALPTPPTTEKVNGGSCPDGDAGCYNHFATLITLSPGWTQYSLKWSQFTQANWGPSGANGIAPSGYVFQKQILALNFAPNDNTKAYDFSVDDIQLGAGAVSGHCGDLITKSQFESFFPGHNGVYTYEGFAEAAKQWPLFCGEGDSDMKKREVAAFFAHMVQETAGLKYTDELNPPSDYCDASKTAFPCGGRSYHGRGPLQLSWNYNYGTAGQALGLNFLTQPELVVASSVNAFNAALWWWMTRQPLNSAHSTIVSGKGFGQTIQLINGPLECGGKSPTAVQTRVNAFNNFCGALGVSPGDNEGC